jgi:hypothetical protein
MHGLMQKSARYNNSFALIVDLTCDFGILAIVNGAAVKLYNFIIKLSGNIRSALFKIIILLNPFDT